MAPLPHPEATVIPPISGPDPFRSVRRLKVLASAALVLSIFVAFAGGQSSTNIFISFLVLLVLHAFAAREFADLATEARRLRILRSGTFVLKSGIEIPFGVGAGLAVQDGFFVILLFFDTSWLSHAYLYPAPASSFEAFLAQLSMGPLSGMAFLVFTIVFWLVYLYLYLIGDSWRSEIDEYLEDEGGIPASRSGLGTSEFWIRVSVSGDREIVLQGRRIVNAGGEPVILFPGFFQNALAYDLSDDVSLARYLVSKGFDVWMVHPRGTALSGGKNERTSIDDIAAFDIPAVIRFVGERTGLKPIFVGHSQGGIAAIISMMGTHIGSDGVRTLSDQEMRSRQESLRGLVTLGSYPDFRFSGRSWLKDFVHKGIRLKIGGVEIPVLRSSWLLALLQGSRFVGTPFSHEVRVALPGRGPERVIMTPVEWLLRFCAGLGLWEFLYHIPDVPPVMRGPLFIRTMDGTYGGILRQFYDAVRSGGMRSLDGQIEYAGAYGRLALPVHFVSMEFDTLADPAMMREGLFARVPGPHKHFTMWAGMGHEDHFMDPDKFHLVYEAISMVMDEESPARSPERSDIDGIAALLRRCEADGLAPAYEGPGEKPVAIDGGGAHVFVVSDFHTAEGRNEEGVFNGTENFFADESFERFLSHTRGSLRGRRGLLVINGDFVDFLRIVSVPEPRDLLRWQTMLREVGIVKETGSLALSISDKERDEFGLKTNDFKSVWKLRSCIAGHPAMFRALAEWLGAGHRIVVVKGNHDLEWYWPAVRNALRLELGKRVSASGGGPLADALTRVVLPGIQFVDNSLVIDGELYIEHGHRYDKFSRVQGGPLWGKNQDELNIPFGSFINRYLLNRIELVYPFLDNVRPSENILHVLMRERFFLGMKVLFFYIPFTVHMFPKRYARFMFKPLGSYLLALGIPLCAVVYLLWDRIGILFAGGAPPHGILGTVGQYILGSLRDVALLFLSYLGGRFVSWVQLEEPSSLLSNGKELMKTYPGCRYFTMGHTHNPEQFETGGRWYVNTSTWIPIVEASSAAIREDRSYALLWFGRDAENRLEMHPLARWNDDAGRVEELVLVETK